MCRVGLHNLVEHVREGETYFTCRNCGKYFDKARAVLRSRGSARW
jgi:uncharacterized C2H2 Zn-finger protein